MLIDTHCHLTYDELLGQCPRVVRRAVEAGVGQMITIATTPVDARRAIPLLAEHAEVFLAAGIHPHEAARVSQDELAALRELHAGAGLGAPAGRLLAVGEAGLDFHYDFAPPDRQEEVFRAQLQLACDVGRPVILHARKSEERVCEILADYPALRGKAVFHCFSGDAALLRRVLDGGWWVSFTGVVTFRNADALREAARAVPSDRFMVETDAPFLSPEPVRRARPCEPAFVAHTARFLAHLRSESFADLAARTTANARRFFALPEADA
jgi:TatD DNase family protein